MTAIFLLCVGHRAAGPEEQSLPGYLRSFSEPGTCQILIRPSHSERLFSSQGGVLEQLGVGDGDVRSLVKE